MTTTSPLLQLLDALKIATDHMLGHHAELSIADVAAHARAGGLFPHATLTTLTEATDEHSRLFLQALSGRKEYAVCASCADVETQLIETRYALRVWRLPR